MKNIIRTLGLVGLVALSNGCRKQDEIIAERTFIGENFASAVVELNYYSPKPDFEIYSISTYRNYPCAGPQKPLPRAEVKIYKSGRKTVNLYFPKN